MKMPFKLNLKKSRQYNVSSKKMFVLSVELLDNTSVECTLSAQSLGQECLHNVSQRLGLQQPQYFGLRFLSKKGTFWWVDLQRPLKKQLDKYALESCNLYLGVMFFVSDVNILHDEVTRYHYFLQLKSDILEGKLCCNEEQTILFASYSFQAEFGDHDPERHTTEYLKNFGLLPKHLMKAKENVEAILEQVIFSHRNLQGMSQQLAEVYYIIEAQRLNGYGLECFAGKDSSSNPVVVGVSLMGIYIWYLNNLPSAYFPWDQILNLVHHKRCFGIEHRKNRKVMQIYMEDFHLSKYVWKTSIQQHGFYTKNEGFVRSSSDSSAPEIQSPSMTSGEHKPSILKVEIKSKLSMQESQDSIDGLGVYHTEGRYSERIASSKSYNHILEGNQQELSSSQMPSRSTSSTCLSAVDGSTQHLHNSSLSLLLQKSSSNASINQMQAVLQEPIRHPLEAQVVFSPLPTYRQAPDYDTAIKLKYGFQNCSTGAPSHSFKAQMVVESFPNVQQQAPTYNQYKNCTDLSHLDSNVDEAPSVNHSNILVRSSEFVSAPSLHAPAHTYSSPDLATLPLGLETAFNVKEQPSMVYHFKPPPPYPYKQGSSSSTPDLSKNNPALVSHSMTSSHRPDMQRLHSYEPVPIGSAKIVTSNVIQHHTIASSHPLNSSASNSFPVHSYENCGPAIPKSAPVQNHNLATMHCISKVDSMENCLSAINFNIADVHFAGTMEDSSFPLLKNGPVLLQNSSTKNNVAFFQSASKADVVENCVPSQNNNLSAPQHAFKGEDVVDHPAGPMFMAAMNGLSLSQPSIFTQHPQEPMIPNDTKIQALERFLADGQGFLEFERIIKKKPNADFTTALLPENAPRNRFKDVFPYEENRVCLTPTSENKTGYINASHLSVSLGTTQKYWIAAQGPLPNTLYSFWQMIWEHSVYVIVMLTEVQEQGRDKCFPYWPQEDGKKLQLGEFQITRNLSMSSSTYVTCSLTLCHLLTHQQRNIWHIQYTDWPDHGCPQDAQGFIAFMGEVDAVQRHILNGAESAHSSSIVVHCSAGVGRSGAVILCNIMLHCLDHNQPIDIPKALTHLRLQRMLTVQTLAQYKFVYSVLVQYLKNSRLI